MNVTVEVLTDEHRGYAWIDADGDEWRWLDEDADSDYGPGWHWAESRGVWRHEAGSRHTSQNSGPFKALAEPVPMCPKCAVLPVQSFDPDDTMMCLPCRKISDEESSATEAGDPEAWRLANPPLTRGPVVEDVVNHPSHYTSHPSGVECITITEHMGFNLGNALKYIWRCDLKNDAIEDLRKARFYVEREIAKRERQLSDER